MNSTIDCYSLILFCALTILISFALTPVLSYAIRMQILPPDVENLFVVMVPSIIAVVLAGMTDGRKSVAALLKKLLSGGSVLNSTPSQ